MRRLRTLATAGALLAVAACASDAPLATGSDDPNGSLISTTGDITIVSPEVGAVFTPSSVPVEIELTGARIIEEATTHMQPDEGHVHVKLDGETLTQLAGLRFDLVELREEPLDPGTHLLEVEFVAGNHLTFSPREIEQLTFTVRRNAETSPSPDASES